MNWFVNIGGSSIKLLIEGPIDNTALIIELRCIGLEKQIILVHANNITRSFEECVSDPTQAAKLIFDVAKQETNIRGWNNPEIISYRVKFAGILSGTVAFDERLIARIEDDSYLNVHHAALCLAARRCAEDFYPIAKNIAIFDSGRFENSIESKLPFNDKFLHRYELFGNPHHGLANEAIFNLLNKFNISRSIVINVHIGSGASISAFIDGKIRYNTMLFSAYDGPIMNNRCGDLPPGIILRLLQNGYNINNLPSLLGENSGIYGLLNSPNSDQITVQKLLKNINKDSDFFYINSFTDKISAAINRVGTPDLIIFSGGVAGALPELIYKIIGNISSIDKVNLIYNPPETEESELVCLAKGKLEIYFAKVDEFKVMRDHLSDPRKYDSPILGGKCIVPGIGLGYLVEFPILKTENLVVFAPRLTPELVIKNMNCAAILVEEGDPTCHGAAIARESDIPCLTNVSFDFLKNLGKKDRLLIDAAAEEIYVMQN